MLKTQFLSLEIGGHRPLQQVSVAFQPGKIHMLLGPNGSGKSSFVNTCSGKTKSYSGALTFDGVPLRKLDIEHLARIRALLSQHNHLAFPMTVEDVVMMGRYPHFRYGPGQADRAICQQCINLLQLSELSTRNYLSLSGGEQQRVHLARVLAQVWGDKEDVCKYLFLDEPLSGLDISFQYEFLRTLRKIIHPKMVLLLVIHNINQAIEYGDALYFFRQGRLAAQTDNPESIDPELIKAIFGVEALVISNPVSGKPYVIVKPS